MWRKDSFNRKVVKVSQSGLVVAYELENVFIPASLVADRYINNLEEYNEVKR